LLKSIYLDSVSIAAPAAAAIMIAETNKISIGFADCIDLFIYQMPGTTCPVMMYAPMAAMIPTIARRPLSFSAVSLNIVSLRELLCHLEP